MLVIAYAVAIYVYLLLIGWGPACLILPTEFQTYRLWLAPWMGSILASFVLVWLSRIGIDAALGTYILTAVAIIIGGFTFLLKRTRGLGKSDLSLPLTITFAATLCLILISLLRISKVPTTISAGNNDPFAYVAVADFLKHGSIAHVPAIDSQRLMTATINNWMETTDRPGSHLQISLFAQLFNVPSYRVFSVMLAVVFAMAVPLAGIFANSMAAGRSATLLTLALSVFNVYQLYWYYQGYAPQLLSQGCIVIFFILLVQFDQDLEHYFRRALLLGLLISVVSAEYPEGLPFILFPYGIYAVICLLSDKESWRSQFFRFFAPLLIGVIVDPISFWHCMLSLRGDAVLVGGSAMPRWALPADVIGITNFNTLGISRVAAIVLSVPVVYFAIVGCLTWPNRRLTLATVVTMGVFLFHARIDLDYSYGYHKILAVYSFFIVAACATGLMKVLLRYRGIASSFSLERAVVTGAVLISLIQAWKVAHGIKYSRHVVTSDLVQLRSLLPLIGNHTVIVTTHSYWNQVWQVYFLEPTPAIVTWQNPYFADLLGGTPSPRDYLLADRDGAAVEGRKLLWQNKSYALYGAQLENP
jgi:hypothetical protein